MKVFRDSGTPYFRVVDVPDLVLKISEHLGLVGVWWCLSYDFDPKEKHEKSMLWHLWDAIKVIYHCKLYKK